MIKKEFIYFFLTIFFGISREQIVLFFFRNNKFKFLSNTKFEIFIILFIVFFAIDFVLSTYERSIISFDINYLIFIFYPLLSYFPLLLFIFYISCKLELEFKMNSTLKSILTPMVIIFFIPYFIGYEMVGKNIVRLSNLSFLLLLNFFVLFINQQKKLISKNLNFIFQNNFLFLFFFIILLIQQAHPTFSKLKILNIFRYTL